MFAAVAAGISCGVFGYGIAIVGTLGFCGAAIVLYFLLLVRNAILTGCSGLIWKM
jgi:hypothetical protein